MTQPMQDRVALVTGAAGGIGRATALAFAARGAAVAVADVNAAGAEETARAISEAVDAPCR
ncbi:MAG: SDR family NAD(P)-dependent oxidoreductase [Caldilineaceae bacterium]